MLHIELVTRTGAAPLMPLAAAAARPFATTGSDAAAGASNSIRHRCACVCSGRSVRDTTEPPARASNLCRAIKQSAC